MNAFVLSGGANLGAIQAGMAEGLLESGVMPDIIVGTSIGAANAAFLAAGPNTERAAALSDLWRSIKPSDVFPVNPLGIARAVFRGGSVFSSAPLRRLVEREVPYRRIEDASVPLRVVATRFEDGSETVFERGSIVDAVLASTALPGVFPPHEIDGDLYLDGGLVDHVPLCPAVDAGADTMFVLSVGSPCPPPKNHRSARALLAHSIGILLSQRIRLDVDHLKESHPSLRVLQIPPVCGEIGLRDFSRSAQLIERARTQTIRFISELGIPNRSSQGYARASKRKRGDRRPLGIDNAA